jgi:hypothetical protein
MRTLPKADATGDFAMADPIPQLTEKLHSAAAERLKARRSAWTTRTLLTDKQNHSDYDEGGTDSHQEAALPGTANCQKYNTDAEKYGGRSLPPCRAGDPLVGHAPNDTSFSRSSARHQVAQAAQGSPSWL